ncbi:hypothetical protein EV421DRAFT_2022406 [Armillaria borealis]|uniref:GST N-terminal domain-containing protein n=1 Tax=Armillaria borealis TaxID=47425 RepID=A0AA39MJ04_9AGAR|nr:hypothetical protein EV421DRAFT_2022406 [Armillaria borealis]
MSAACVSMINQYDLPTKAVNSPGTMMTCRTRYASNIVDVEVLAKKIGAAPTSTKPDVVSPFYSMPIIYDESIGAVVSDSAVIAAYLDKAYPSSGPVLIPTGTKALQLAFSSAVIDAFAAFRPFFPFDTEKDERSDDGFFHESETGWDCQDECGGRSRGQCLGRRMRSGIASWNDGRCGKYLESFEPNEKLL